MFCKVLEYEHQKYFKQQPIGSTELSTRQLILNTQEKEEIRQSGGSLSRNGWGRWSVADSSEWEYTL